MTQPLFPSPEAPLKIGTRGSPLALAQAHETRQRLMASHGLPEAAFDIVVIQTSGDNRQLIDADRPLKEIGNKGLFTKEIEEALLAGRIDIAVHSCKDMPCEQPLGLVLDCVLPREDVRDAFVSLTSKNIADLPDGARVGTSSLRRRAQLLMVRPDLQVIEFRGNVQTRLKKLGDGLADATFLAMAGLNRLGLDVPKTPVDTDVLLPAVAQGAITIERRCEDATTARLLAAIHDTPTATRIRAERAFLAALDGSCETPIAALATLHGDQIHLRGEILRPDGSQRLSEEGVAPVAQASELGRSMGQSLLKAAPKGFFDWHR